MNQTKYALGLCADAVVELGKVLLALLLMPLCLLIGLGRDIRSALRLKLLWGAKDGGPESRVYVWGLESKRLGSVLLLRFDEGSREMYHTHAFNALSWVLRGHLDEAVLVPRRRGLGRTVDYYAYKASVQPIVTRRERLHKVTGMAPLTWVLSFRGPWVDHWAEGCPVTGEHTTLTHGRKEVARG